VSVLTEIAHGFRRNLLLIGGCYGVAEGCALATGAPPVPGDLAGIAVGAALSVLAYPSVHEPLLRRVTRRPRTTMTLEDWRQLREMERELDWELSEPPASVAESARPAPAAVECIRCGQARVTPVGGMCVPCRRQERRVMTATPIEPAGTALNGPGFLPAPMTGPGGRWRPLSELPEVKADGGIPAEPLIENMRRELEGHAPVTWDDVAYASEASEHFAALARVGRESCIVPARCPICAARALDTERELRAAIGLPDAGAHDYHIDSAGREWCRDGDDLWWIKPAPGAPWYRQNKA
jgi:hypothetical protein